LTMLISVAITSSIPAPAATGIFTLSLHDALPIWDSDEPPRFRRRHRCAVSAGLRCSGGLARPGPLDAPDDGAALASGRDCRWRRSEEHTSELQSRENLVCRLLLEKKNAIAIPITI